MLKVNWNRLLSYTTDLPRMYICHIYNIQSQFQLCDQTVFNAPQYVTCIIDLYICFCSVFVKFY